MRNTISAPVALIAVGLAAAAAILYFGHFAPDRPQEQKVFVLPYAPPVDDAELSTLRKALAPLGVTIVFPPLPQDRFQGVRIATVARNTPAQAAGLRGGDLIVRFGEYDMTTPPALAAMSANADSDKSYTVVYRRDGEEHEATVTGITSPERIRAIR
ncbi:MAG: PDZ domain-containing protein [Armatimonadetes bacterium]|nr:PDZ domain-containing protein [Armatimonadota bacterium]